MKKLVTAGVALVAALATHLGPSTVESYPLEVRTTFYYPTGSVMRDGTYPYFGAAACDWNYLPLGTVFYLDGMPFECRDTGSGVCGHHVDLFAPDVRTGRWLAESIGTSAVIEVVNHGQNPSWWRWWMGCQY